MLFQSNHFPPRPIPPPRARPERKTQQVWGGGAKEADRKRKTWRKKGQRGPGGGTLRVIVEEENKFEDGGCQRRVKMKEIGPKRLSPAPRPSPGLYISHPPKQLSPTSLFSFVLQWWFSFGQSLATLPLHSTHPPRQFTLGQP